MPDTLGSIKSEIIDWLDESTIPDGRINSAVNDAVENLWGSLTTLCVSLFIGGPVGLSLSTGMEGVVLISVPDPILTLSTAVVTSGFQAAHTVALRYTYVTESGSETMAGPEITVQLNDNQVVNVSAPPAVTGAIGWNLYAFSTFPPFGASYAKQNDAPIDFSVSFQEPDNGFVSGPNHPALPSENTTGDDICYIRLLEAQMPDLGYKTYDAAAIDSLLFRKAARNISTSTQYSNYYWDLINQRQLEFRPALGFDWAPRYFYVKRPRRLRFDNAPLPFLTVPATAFLRNRALARLSLSIREYESAAAYEAISDKEKEMCELVVMQMNHKNLYITPYNAI